MVKIEEIDAALDQCEVTATITTLGEIRSYGKTGKYINIELFDGANIKLTLFGNDVNKTIGLQAGKTYRFENVRSKLANLNFRCVNAKNYELLSCQDFKWTEATLADSTSMGKEVFENLEEATNACDEKGIAYWTGLATIKKAEIFAFYAECPNIQCAGELIENENAVMVCQKCLIEYNACNHNVILSVDATINNSAYKMLSNGKASFAFLNMGSFEFIHKYTYDKQTLISKITALSGQQFSLFVKMSMNSTTKTIDCVIENVTESVPEENNSVNPKKRRFN